MNPSDHEQVPAERAITEVTERTRTAVSEASVPDKPIADRFIRFNALICAVGLGGFLAWAGLAPLAEGVPAGGQIVVENDRQVIQHLEGGIIRELRVRDGDFVQAGQTLLVLEETASLAARDQVLQEIAGLEASLQRLDALRAGLDEPDFSVLDAMALNADSRAEIEIRQRDLFEQQKQSFEADLAVLTARRDGAQSAQVHRRQQIQVTRRGLETAREQLELIAARQQRQMARLDELRAMERDVAAMEADISRLEREAQEAATLELDLGGQIEQTHAAFRTEISAESLEVRTQLEQAEERLTAAQDVLTRSEILAPQGGEILNLQFSTRGGVVRPGETILEIVPDLGETTAVVRIRPSDRAAVFEGQSVRTRLSAYKSWMTPRLDGVVSQVSADLKTDQLTGESYYEVRVTIPLEEMTKVEHLDVIPGMPLEVFIFSGRSRTLMDYVIEPIGESLFRGTRTR
ncbi:HlyD family type I secretion periplasmic adaptor subunit [Maricaulis sp. D1M11]|uniref:HlyD family type I secretion periplasmic adaptor subunit n=1 Tax=Maricaulis sp. D1M11 TaxID=3076117 RepID=UPI0039B62338